MRSKAVVLLSALITITMAMSAQTSVREQDRAALEQIVREYILQHPEVIAQAANLYQQRELAAQKARQKEAVTLRLKDLQQDADSPTFGSADGVSVVEFFDYHCGYCRRTDPVIQNLLLSHSDVRVVFKEFPILGPESILAAKAGLAAQKQGGYLKLHKALMAWSGPLTLANIEFLATKEGLDAARLKTDMNSPGIALDLERNSNLASQLGVTATPSIVVGGELVAGALDAAGFEKLIAQAKSANAQAPVQVTERK